MGKGGARYWKWKIENSCQLSVVSCQLSVGEEKSEKLRVK